MSLRLRLMASIVCVLFVSLLIGGLAAGWHAVRSVRTEMQAALAVGAQTLRNGLDDLPNASDPGDELSRLVHAFDGDRHVRATLRDAVGFLVASTPPALKPKVPEWFVALLAPSLAPIHLEGGSDSVLAIEADPRNEVAEVWTQFQDDLVAVGLFCGLSIALVSLVVGRALRPLDRLSVALASFGSGEFAVRVQPAGPPELVRLARGLNAMAERLDEAQARNLRLTEQLLTLQEEERTDLARDLHDEVGPFLFAVHLDAAAIEQAAVSSRIEDVQERAHAIREAVGHMQRHVRAMLHRLRSVDPVEGGLAPALDNLVTFWRARRQAIAYSLDVSVNEDAIDDSTLAAIYRLVQEGLSNAVRHGRPQRIEIAVQPRERGAIVVRVADDGTGLPQTGSPPSDSVGLGFMGMRERVEGLGGTLHVGPGEDGKGLVVTAWLPSAAAMETA
jgi:two-component system, NarL family, sensor histidine kinase UhpB